MHVLPGSPLDIRALVRFFGVSFLTIFGEFFFFFFKTQGTRLGATVAPNKDLE